MTENQSNKNLMLQQIPAFVESLEDRISWHWDTQFGCLLAEFSVDHADFVYLKAKQYFPKVWDKKSFKLADEFLQHRAGIFSMLEKQQQLMTKDKDGTEEMMLSWWPWGHGATISVRVFRANSNPYVPTQSLFSKFKKQFSKQT